MTLTCLPTPACDPVTTRLMIDWAELERACDGPTPRCWCEATPCWCVDVGGPDECLERLQAGDDLLALRLLARARQGDVAAARVMLQALVPRLQLGHARPRALSGRLGIAWERVVRHQPRSTSHVLDNLARSCHRAEAAERPPELPTAHPAWPSATTAAAIHLVGAAEPDAAQVISEAFIRGLVDSEAAELLADVYLHGMTARRAGELRGLSEQAVRDRCHRAIRRIRQGLLGSSSDSPGAA